MIGAVDRFLEKTMGTSASDADPEAAPQRSARKGPRPKRPRSGGKESTWKRATAAEGIGVLLILAFVLIARPDGDEAAASNEPDLFEAVATGATADGVVRLSSGAQVHLLGVALPTAEDPPGVREAAVRGLDRIMRGRRVRVEFDPVLPSRMQEGLPQMAAYVWVLDEAGQRKGMANAMLISRGLARPVMQLGYRHQAQFVEAARLAQGRGQGVWQPRPQALPVAF